MTRCAGLVSKIRATLSTKPKPLATCPHAFSRMYSGSSTSDWFIVLFTSVLIGQSDYYWFWFYDMHLIQKSTINPVVANTHLSNIPSVDFELIAVSSFKQTQASVLTELDGFCFSLVSKQFKLNFSRGASVWSVASFEGHLVRRICYKHNFLVSECKEFCSFIIVVQQLTTSQPNVEMLMQNCKRKVAKQLRSIPAQLKIVRMPFCVF